MNKAVVISLCVVLALGEPLVEGPLGKIRGTIQTVLDVNIESFLGIRFAKPPTGKLRFERPQPFGPVGELDAVSYGFSCPQPAVFPLQQYSNSTDSEDCLFLNVFRKQGTRSTDKKAVVVMIHGGGFLWGSGSHVEYNMAPLAGIEDVITVSFNYRLGFLGFGYVEGSEFQNLGMFDQRLALEWVQDNIRAFGGDPDKVTLIGVSAGAISVNSQIITPLNKNRKLFQAALMDAGVAASLFVYDTEISDTRTRCVAKAVGCIDDQNLFECLREVKVDELVKHASPGPCGEVDILFSLAADGTFFPKNAEDYIQNRAEDFLKVKTMIGYARNEGSMFALMHGDRFSGTITDEDFVKLCTKNAAAFGFRTNIKNNKALQQSILEVYLRKFEDPFTAASHFIGDGIFICPSNAFIDRYSKVNDQVYVYRFERLLEAEYYSFNPAYLGVYHISPFVHFTGTFLAPSHSDHKVVDSDKEYMLEAMKVLANFARGNEPLVLRGVQWPNYSKGEGVLVIDNKPSIRSTLSHTQQCQSVYSYFDNSRRNAKAEL